MNPKKRILLAIAFVLAAILLVFLYSKIVNKNKDKDELTPPETTIYTSAEASEQTSSASSATNLEVVEGNSDIDPEDPELDSEYESRQESHFASLATQEGIQAEDILPEPTTYADLEVNLIGVAEEIDWIFNGTLHDTFITLVKLYLTEKEYHGFVTVTISDTWVLERANACYFFTMTIGDDQTLIPVAFDMTTSAFTIEPRDPDPLPAER